MAVMPNMPDFEIWRDLKSFEHRVLADLHLSHRAASQTPAERPVTITTAPPEGDLMSLSADMHALAARLETIGEEAVTKLEAIGANPATKEAFDVLHAITGLNVPPEVISLTATALKGLVAAYAPAPAPAAPAQ